MSDEPDKKPARKRKGEPAGERLAPEELARLFLGFDSRRLPPGITSLDAWVQGKLAPIAEHLGAFIEGDESEEFGPLGTVGNPAKMMLTLRLHGTLAAIEAAKALRAGGQDTQHAEREARDMAMRLTGFIEGFGIAGDFRSWEAAESRRVSGRKTTVRVEIAAKKHYNSMSREEAAPLIADEVGRDAGTVQRMLSESFPGEKWPFDATQRGDKRKGV